MNWNCVTVAIIAFTAGMAFEYKALQTVGALDEIKHHYR